jgi:hypothetical protein
MMTQGGDRGIAHFQILADGVVFGDVRFDFVAESFINGALSSNRCLSCGFRAPAGFFHQTAALRSKPAHLGRALTLAELVTGPLFKFGHIRGLFASVPLAFGAYFSFR